MSRVSSRSEKNINKHVDILINEARNRKQMNMVNHVFQVIKFELFSLEPF